ncbi:MAG: MFS transporter, partial [Acidiferrobacterales bacterium]
SMSNFTVAVVAPEAAPDIGVAATYIGVFTSIVYIFAMLSGTVTGTFMFRYGAVRVCQFTMLAAAAGMVAIALASPFTAVVSAILLGLAYGPFNPASAHVLNKISTNRSRPIIFSIKQTGVPLGGGLAGLMVPLLTVMFGWQVAALTVGVVALVVMVLVQPLRPTFDADRKPNWPLRSASVIAPLRLVLGDRLLRKFSIAGFAYSGCQVSVGAFFVVYLAQALAMSLVQAGLVFACVQAGGIFGRILWGIIAERWLSTRMLLVGLGLLIAVCLVATASFTPGWPLAVIMAVGFVLGASSFGWVGIYLSEIAKLAPEGKVGEATGGTQFIYFGGVVVVPPCFGALVNLTGSYTFAFFVIAALAMVNSFYLMGASSEAIVSATEDKVESTGEIDSPR